MSKTKEHYLQRVCSELKNKKILLIGYYGSGNLGDELLLEVCLSQFHETGIKDAVFYYTNPEAYSKWHKDFGYKQVSLRNKFKLFRTILKSDVLVLGGGGHWGVDSNIATLLLSLIFSLGRVLLGKQVILLGVGFYSSTSFVGKVSAWFATRAATEIYARDQESVDNFSTLSGSKKTKLVNDLSYALRYMDISNYHVEASGIAQRMQTAGKDSVLFSTRGKRNLNHRMVFSELITKHKDREFYKIQFAPFDFNAEDTEFWKEYSTKNKNIQIVDFNFNPISFYLALTLLNSDTKVIFPQYHGLAAAMFAKNKFMPIYYDNKCVQLLIQNDESSSLLHMDRVSAAEVESFILGS